jgi:hypothetical protein
MQDFMQAELPCCGLGVVEVTGQKMGLVALHLNEVLPRKVADLGFRFGHCLLGTSSYEVIHFAFVFYGWKTYNVLINPNNPVAQEFLALMLGCGEYFFLVINGESDCFSFRESIAQESGLDIFADLPRIWYSTTTEDDYRKAVAQFSYQPEPAGQMLQWVCRDDPGYLDLKKDRLVINPSR